MDDEITTSVDYQPYDNANIAMKKIPYDVIKKNIKITKEGI